MNKKEKDRILEVYQRLTKIETTLDLEFKKIREDLKEITKHTLKLNEELGAIGEEFQTLKLRQKVLENKYIRQLRVWKIVAGLISPALTFLIIEFVKRALGL